MVELSENDVELFLLSHSQKVDFITHKDGNKLFLIPEYEFNPSIANDYIVLNSFVLVGFQSFISNKPFSIDLKSLRNIFVVEANYVKKDSQIFMYLLNKSIRAIVNNFELQNLAYE